MPDVVALAGGVGGSKLALGLYSCLKQKLTVIVNTGDDETMYGLRVSPDLDTMRYTLSGMAAETGWGIKDDTFTTLAQLQVYGFDTWFKIGDRDLATDMARTQLLEEGLRLTQVEAQLCRASGVEAQLLPMSDEPVATRVVTPQGELSFQEYFVKRGHADAVTAVSYHGADRATLSAEVRTAFETANLIVLCPSNPVVSIGPILAVPGLRELLRAAGKPRVAISPIVGGAAVSGPAGRLMAALGFEISVLGLAAMYRDFLTAMVVDDQDAAYASQLRALGLDVLVTNTIMRDGQQKQKLAREILDWVGAPCESAAGARANEAGQ